MTWWKPAEASGETLIEDFEEGATWDGDWEGATTDWDNQQTTVLNGSWSLGSGTHGLNDAAAVCTHTSETRAEGTEFLLHFQAVDDADPTLVWGVQDAPTYDNMYWGRINVSDNDADIRVMDAGASTTFVANSALGVTVDLGTHYIMGLEWSSSSEHTMHLYDTDMTLLGSSATGTDSTYTGAAGFGFTIQSNGDAEVVAYDDYTVRAV